MNVNESISQLSLLAVGMANWDYFLKTRVEKIVVSANTKEMLVNSVWYIAKPGSGCKSGWFGDIRHFKNTYRRNHDMTLTELGEKIVFQGYIPE